MTAARKPTRSQLARLQQIAVGAIAADTDGGYRYTNGRTAPAAWVRPVIAAGWATPTGPGQPLALTDDGRRIVAWERRWAPFSPEQRAVLAACYLPGVRPIGADGYRRFYEDTQRCHDYRAEIAELKNAGWIRLGAEHYELTAAGHALFAPLTEREHVPTEEQR